MENNTKILIAKKKGEEVFIDFLGGTDRDLLEIANSVFCSICVKLGLPKQEATFLVEYVLDRIDAGDYKVEVHP